MDEGFTLLELMVALVVAGLLLGIGVPNFLTSIRNSNMTATTNTFVSALHVARSEAIKRRARVTVCRGNIAATAQCDPNGRGYAVFVNAADDQTIDGGDVVLRRGRWLRDNVDAIFNGLPPYVSFAASGFTRAIGGGPLAGDIIFCDPRGSESARVLTVWITGRPMIRSHSEVPAIPECP